MLIKIVSGNVSVNKRSAYGKWLLGWIDGGGLEYLGWKNWE